MSNTVEYYLTMNDSYGDGWNGNILGFRQGNKTITFGQQMKSSMRRFGPVKITL